MKTIKHFLCFLITPETQLPAHADGLAGAGPAKQGHAVNTSLYARRQPPCCRRSLFRSPHTRCRPSPSWLSFRGNRVMLCVFAVNIFLGGGRYLHGPGQSLDRYAVSPSPCAPRCTYDIHGRISAAGGQEVRSGHPCRLIAHAHPCAPRCTYIPVGKKRAVIATARWLFVSTTRPD